MVGLHITPKKPVNSKAPQKESVVARMARLAAGDALEPGVLVDVGGGYITVREDKKALKTRAEQALKNKPAFVPVKAATKKVVVKASYPAVTVQATAGAVTRKVGGATSASAISRITAWSYSRFNTWLACPLSAKFKFIDKLKEPGSAAMQRGTEIHGLAEQYAKGLLKNLPLELQKFKAEFLDLVKRKPECEGEWAFRDDWSETTWFGKDAWCRVKTDVAYYDAKTRTVVVIDHKTGKPRAEHAGQLSLYAIGAFIKYPEALKVSALLWYLDHGEETSQTFTRAQLGSLQKEWSGKVAPMLADTRFQALPGNACRFCHFKNSNGGPCRY